MKLRNIFIVVLLIVSVIMRERNFLKQINKLSNATASSRIAIEQKEKMIEKIETKQVPNAQIAAFLVFVLGMIYYGVYAILLASGPGVSLSPGVFLTAVFPSIFGVTMLTFVLALIVLALGGKRFFDNR